MTGVEIALTNGYVALVDDADAAAVAAHRWYGERNRHTVYAARSVYTGGRKRSLRMHTEITGWSMVDHVNGDGLDNRRANLRPTTHRLNLINTPGRSASGFKGVKRRGNRWHGQIVVDGRHRYLGSFPTPQEAARAYDAAARHAFGAHAWLNFPEVRP